MTELIIITIATLVASLFTRRHTSTVHLERATTTLLLNVFRSMSHSILGWHFEKHRDFRNFVDRFLVRPTSYKVKHILLIDRESGIQIESVSSKGGDMLNGDAISAMFSAIQSFVQDAFSRDKSSKLTYFRVGDHTIQVSHGPKLMLACVMVGQVPKTLKNELDHTLQKIQFESLETFSDLSGRENGKSIARIMKKLIAVKQPMTLVERLGL